MAAQNIISYDQKNGSREPPSGFPESIQLLFFSQITFDLVTTNQLILGSLVIFENFFSQITVFIYYFHNVYHYSLPTRATSSVAKLCVFPLALTTFEMLLAKNIATLFRLT